MNWELIKSDKKTVRRELKNLLEEKFKVKFSLRTYKNTETIHIIWTRDAEGISISQMERFLNELGWQRNFFLDRTPDDYKGIHMIGDIKEVYIKGSYLEEANQKLDRVIKKIKTNKREKILREQED